MLPKAREALAGISDRMEDILIYALYPMTGLEFIKKKKEAMEMLEEAAAPTP